MKPVALDHDMVAHRLGGRLRVACSNRGDDRVVFRERAGHAIAHLELHASVRLQHRVQPRGLLREEGVVRRLVDAVVEVRVAQVVGLDLARLGQFPTRRVNGLELRELGIGDPPGREPGAHRLDLGHDLEALGELAGAPFGDVGAALGQDPDEARRLELLQRFADRGARAVELLRERLGIESRSRRIPAVDDGVLQRPTNADRVRNRAHAALSCCNALIYIALPHSHP